MICFCIDGTELLLVHPYNFLMLVNKVIIPHINLENATSDVVEELFRIISKQII